MDVRALIRERTQAGQARYRQYFESGKVGKTITSRSGRNLPPYRPKRIFDREDVFELRRQGRSYRQIARSLGLGLGTVVWTLQARAKIRSRQLEHSTACWLWRCRGCRVEATG
jgi:DNA invertase Pin-like site-specific DNA recombinase